MQDIADHHHYHHHHLSACVLRLIVTDGVGSVSHLMLSLKSLTHSSLAALAGQCTLKMKTVMSMGNRRCTAISHQALVQVKAPAAKDSTT
jgi:hypothetical protein